MAIPEFEMKIFDPFDMDREEFNPAMCMLRFSGECTLPNMLAKKRHIDREIQVLNNDIQNMLYNNYQKIDKVASVVVNMTSDFSKMEQKMDDLYDQMNGISRTSSKILESFQPVENKISKLIKAQKTVKKLSLLTDLVPTLKMYADSGLYNAAARCYLKAKKLLQKFSHFPSFSGIVNDCSEVLSKIKSELRNKLNSEIYKQEELVETFHLLLALQESPKTLLIDFFVRSEKNLAKLLDTLNDTWDENASQVDSHSILSKLDSYIKSCCNYVEKISKVLETVKCAFQSRKYIGSDFLDTTLEEFFTNHMSYLRINLVHHLKRNFQSVDDNLLSQVLDKFIRKCHEVGIMKTGINFYNEGLDISLQICISRCEVILERMKEHFNEQLVNVNKELCTPKNISKLVLYLVERTEQKLMSVLLSLVLYVRPEFRCCREVAFRKVFCKIVVREATFVAFCKYVIEQSQTFLTENCFEKPSLCIVLIRFSLDMSSVVSKVLSKVDDYLISPSDDFSLTSDETITTEFKSMAVSIAYLYIRTRSQGLTHLIQISMENKNWMESKEPTRPRPVVKLILKDLLEAKLEIEKIFGACLSPVKKKSSDLEKVILCETYYNTSKSKQYAIEEKVLLNKLFLEFPISTTKVQLNSSDILNSLLKDTLNSFIQLIRLKTLNHFSLQQIQVDVIYMQCHLTEFIEMDPTVYVLFDEIMSSACNRTVNPELMSSCVVSFICNDALYLTE